MMVADDAALPPGAVEAGEWRDGHGLILGALRRIDRARVHVDGAERHRDDWQARQLAAAVLAAADEIEAWVRARHSWR